MAASLFAEDRRLKFEVHKFSSFSTDFIPENITVDSPKDQMSRWTAQTNSPPQYLILKLQRPSFVRKIKFGKFEKSHVCNVKKFRIFGGLDDSNMVQLLEGGLRNDNVPETFDLRYVTEDGSAYLPILFLKIVPLLSWSPTFNFTIWYIEMLGVDDPMCVNPSIRDYHILREVEVVKLCLKHFRQLGYDAAFNALQQQTQVELEHPLNTELHKCLVLEGDFEKTEELISECVAEGLMDDHLTRKDYRHKWEIQAVKSNIHPGNRGGHQLVVDTNKRLVYLYGGWNGYQDLSDLWVFDITTSCWTQLFERTELVNGPSPRSCHKMVFDPVSENIFMIGRYLDNSIRTTDYIKSDFFLYDTRANSWLQICDDTCHVGGPQLVFDHQMCIDAEKRMIYVFGGKVLTPRRVTVSSTNEPEYSGLFSYHIATNAWTQIMVDCHHGSAAQADVLSIESRVTHCMVFHNKTRKLYVYGGQRDKEDMDEFFTYDVDTQAINVLNKRSTEMGPSPGYTLRATIDCERDEIYVFSSLSKTKDRREINEQDAFNSFWVYAINAKKWSHIYTCKPSAGEKAANDLTSEPCPRYAHQLVYDEISKLHYLFGGNPGNFHFPQLRLDDFWTLHLEKPKREEILRHCRFLVRRLHYEEMVHSNPYKAMEYLRKNIAEVIDHTHAEQLINFHKLASLLFKFDDGSEFDERVLLETPTLGKLMKLDTQVAIKAESNDKTNDSTESGNGPSTGEEDTSQKSDFDGSNPNDDISMDSCESSASSGIWDLASYAQYRKCGGKRSRNDYFLNLRSRRAHLFNELAILMSEAVTQPRNNLSDFVTL